MAKKDNGKIISFSDNRNKHRANEILNKSYTMQEVEDMLVDTLRILDELHISNGKSLGGNCNG